MSRASAVAARADLEAPESPHALIAFVTITHPALAEPIRAVCDVLDHVRDGVTWPGVLFEYRLVSDSDGNPESRLRLPNVDRRLSQAVRFSGERPKVALDLCSTADFDLSVVPRVPLGTVTPIYAFAHFRVASVEADATVLEAELILQDYTVEPVPAIRATQDRLPGLWR